MAISIKLPNRLRRVLPPSGFTLIEVMITLVVISFGLLGIAGMQALAFSNTGIARTRSLAALEASSMAAAITANQAYWANTLVSSVSVVGGTVDPALPVDDPDHSKRATNDLLTWGTDVAANLPSGTGKVVCTGATVAAPITCLITVTWVENQGHDKATAGNKQSYQMVVTP